MTKERILIVEDEALVAEELRENLELLGYEVAGQVTRGEEVVEAVARERPDLVIMDVRLGGDLDGVEAAFQARAEFGVPVIYLSAFSDRETLMRASRTSPAAYLLKPYNERELAANLAMALAAARSADGSRERLRANRPMLDALSLPALLVDPAGTIIHANEAALASLKLWEPSRIRGEPLSRFVDLGPQGDTERVRIVAAADGSATRAVVRISPLTIDDRGEIGALVTLDSMSDRERGLLERSAEAMNEAILAKLPDEAAAGHGWETRGFLEPCPSGSGDLYDLLPAGEEGFCFFALDVMGHGPHASLIAWSIRDLVRAAVARDRGAGPTDILRRVNEKYGELSFGPGTVFFTATLGVVERATGRYRICRAGHPPALVAEPGAALRWLRGKGMAIGVSEELVAEELSGILPPGGRIFLPSDGLMEAVEPREGGGAPGGFAGLVEEGRDSPLGEAVDAIRQALGQRGSADDASLLAIERSPS